MSIVQLGDAFDMTRQNVSNILKQMRVPTRKPVPKKYLCTDCDNEYTHKEMGSGRYSCKRCLERRKELWAPRKGFEACICCNKTEHIHAKNGLCIKCYNPIRNKENKEYFRQYYKRPEVLAKREEWQKSDAFKRYQKIYNRNRSIRNGRKLRMRENYIGDWVQYKDGSRGRIKAYDNSLQVAWVGLCLQRRMGSLRGIHRASH